MAPPPCPRMAFADQLRGVESAAQIDLQGALPVPGIELQQGELRADGGVVDQDIDAAPIRQHLVDHVLDRHQLGHVEDIILDLAPGQADLLQGEVQVDR